MLPKLSQRIRKYLYKIYITYSKSIYAIQTIAYILLSIQENRIKIKHAKKNDVHRKFTRTFLFALGKFVEAVVTVRSGRPITLW